MLSGPRSGPRTARGACPPTREIASHRIIGRSRVQLCRSAAGGGHRRPAQDRGGVPCQCEVECLIAFENAFTAIYAAWHPPTRHRPVDRGGGEAGSDVRNLVTLEGSTEGARCSGQPFGEHEKTRFRTWTPRRRCWMWDPSLAALSDSSPGMAEKRRSAVQSLKRPSIPNVARDKPEWLLSVPSRLQLNGRHPRALREHVYFSAEDRRRATVGLVKRGSVSDVSAGISPLLSKVLGPLQFVIASLAFVTNSSDGE